MTKKKKTRWDKEQPKRIPCEKCGMPILPFWLKRHKITCDKIPSPAELWQEMQTTPMTALEEIYNVSSRKMRQHIRLYASDEEARVVGRKMQGIYTKNVRAKERNRKDNLPRHKRNGACKHCTILLTENEKHLCEVCVENGVTWIEGEGVFMHGEFRYGEIIEV